MIYPKLRVKTDGPCEEIDPTDDLRKNIKQLRHFIFQQIVYWIKEAGLSIFLEKFDEEEFYPLNTSGKVELYDYK